MSATARDFTSGFTGSASYAQLILSACNKDPLPQAILQPLPPRHEATHLVQHYFDNFFALYPFFQETSFFASLDALYETRGSVAAPFDHFIVRMVLAISHAGMLEQRGDTNYMAAVGHVSAALTHAEAVFRPGSVKAVQAMLLLHEYAMIDPHHFDSWTLIGAASRAMVDIGLHQDPPKGSSMSRSKLELRRRVFWSVYAFDRSTSLVQTRAFTFSDDSADVNIPFASAQSAARQAGQLSNTTTNIMLKTLNSAPELFKLRKLQSAWYTELFQSGREPWPDPYPRLWTICQSMKSWWDELPETINKHIRSFFELNLLYSYVYVLAPSPRVPCISPFAQSLIFEYAIQYSEKITTHAGNRVHAAPISFYDAMRAYMTGQQFIEVLLHNQDRLLSGSIPELPCVPTDSVPPPPVPDTPKDVLANITRSIACIKNYTDCLGLFGLRWGYMSWRDCFQRDAEDLLNALNRRSWELQHSASSMSGQSIRPSFRHDHSFGSDTQNTPSPYGQQQIYPSPSSQPSITPTYPPEVYGYFDRQGQSVPSVRAAQSYNAQQPLSNTSAAQQFQRWSGLGGNGHGQGATLHDDTTISPPLDVYHAP